MIMTIAIVTLENSSIIPIVDDKGLQLGKLFFGNIQTGWI